MGFKPNSGGAKTEQPHLFDTDIQPVKCPENTFEVPLSGNWTINGIPNGGYLMAVMANCMMQVCEKGSTPIVTAGFLSRCRPGTSRITVRPIAESRQFNRIEARLFQEGEEKIRAMGTFAARKDECFIERTESPPPDIASVADAIRIPSMEGYTLYDNVELKLDPDCIGWVNGSFSEQSEQKGWIRFHRERPADIPSVLLFSDAFPPAVLTSQGMVAWVPTVEMSVNIRRLPETPWVKGIFRTRFITCGLLEEDGELWDENGSLVAISRQIAVYRK